MITRSRTDLSGLVASAVFSDCERYRYRLDWRWSRDTTPLVAIMLNPSTATHEALDPTIAGLVKRARLWGLGGVVVTNLFAYRATEPTDMLAAADPVGEHNDDQIRLVLREEVMRGSGTAIAAWGKHGSHRGRASEVLAIVRSEGAHPHALQLNVDGSPRHPLYVAHDRRPETWHH